MKNAKWYRFYYTFQHMLSVDKWYLESLEASEPSMGGGVRKESSLPFALNQLAEEMTDIEMNISMDEQKLSFHMWFLYSRTSNVINKREKESDILTAKEITQELYEYFLKNKGKEYRHMLDDNTIADKFFEAKDGNGKTIGIFCTNRTGYLNGLYSFVKGKSKELFKLRLRTASYDLFTDMTHYELHCTGEFLKEFYEQQGFDVTCKYKLADNLATSNWDYEKFGRPNTYQMKKEI